MNTRSRAVEASVGEYPLGDAVPLEDITDVPSGTSVLVAGPAMLGTEQIALDVLDHGLRRDENAVIISPDRPANRVLSRFDGRPGPDASVMQVVDCSAANATDDAVEGDQVTRVASPGNLTEVGVSLTKATQALDEGETAGIRVALLSLSTLVHYTDVDRVFKFVHVTTSRFAAGGYLCVATIDTAADGEALNTIKAQFDRAIELREGPDGRREIRAQGFPGGSTAWHPG